MMPNQDVDTPGQQGMTDATLSPTESELSPQEYLSILIHDKETLSRLPVSPFVCELVEQEIARLLSKLSTNDESATKSNCDDKEDVILTHSATVPAERDERTMDQFAPRETLAEIASYLSSKDFNSLARASKTARWKLDGYRQITKVDVEIQYVVQDYCGQLSFQVKIEHRKGDRFFKAVLCAEKRDHTLSEEEIETEVAGFYYRNRENPLNWNNAVTNFCFGIEEGITRHLSFLQERNVVIESLILGGLSNTQLASLMKQLEQRPSQVLNLNLEYCPYDASHVCPLIRICKTWCLTVRYIDWGEEADPPESFFELPEIQKVATLIVFDDDDDLFHNNPLNSHQLLLLAATTIDLNYSSSVTAEGLRSFLIQWIESKRDVNSVQLQNNSPLASADCWAAVLKGLDHRQVEIVNDPTAFTATLRRLNDGAQILLKWKWNCISLNST